MAMHRTCVACQTCVTYTYFGINAVEDFFRPFLGARYFTFTGCLKHNAVSLRTLNFMDNR